MAVFSSLAAIAGAIGAAAGIAGTVVNYMGAQKAAAGQERAEKLRETQTKLEEARQRRAVVRQAQVARATAGSNATSQGAQDGSGLAGGIGQIQGQAGSTTAAISENAGISSGMFQANRTISQGQTMSSIGQGISSLGGALVNSQEPIGRLGAYFSGSRSPA